MTEAGLFNEKLTKVQDFFTDISRHAIFEKDFFSEKLILLYL